MTIPATVRQAAIDAVQDTIVWTGYMGHEDVIDVALPAALAALMECEEVRIVIGQLSCDYLARLGAGVNSDLDALETLARRATPGPWEQGDVWQWAGVMPEKFGEGRCALCERHGEPVWVGKTTINGTAMLVHKHRDPEPWNVDHLISSEAGLVAGPYDYDTGGIMRGEDCAYIAAVSPDVVLALIERLRLALPEPPAPPEDCCCNAEWRGRLCSYHQGFEDGWEALRAVAETVA